MLSDVEKGNNLMLTRLTSVATLIDTKQQSATTSFSTQILTFSWHLCNRRDARVESHTHAKSDEFVLSVRNSAQWPLRPGFVEQCCSRVQRKGRNCAKLLQSSTLAISNPCKKTLQSSTPATLSFDPSNSAQIPPSCLTCRPPRRTEVSLCEAAA